MRILVTGATGFVGGHLVKALSDAHEIVAVARREVEVEGAREVQVVPAIDGATDWTGVLDGVDVVLHLAARVHVMHETSDDPLAEFREVNCAGTVRLAEACVRQGVKRLVFVSSIKVNGEATTGEPFSAGSDPAPVDPYGISKWEAEQALRAIGERDGLEVVVLRPPVIYGSGVKGNIERIIKLVRTRLPLPIGGIANRRTMLSVGNLVRWIKRAVSDAPPDGVVLLGDPEPISTAVLARSLARGMRIRTPQLPIPVGVINALARLAGMGTVARRLTEDLVIDPTFDAFPGIKEDLDTSEESLTALGTEIQTTNSAHLGFPEQPVLLYGITIGKSANSFLRGQLAWFREQGWRVVLTTSPDEAGRAAALRESVELDPVPMARSVSLADDVRALVRWFGVVRRQRPNAVNVSTPKAGLLGGIAAWCLRVPKRIYMVRGLRLEGVHGLFGKLLYLMEWLSVRLATDVVFVSPSLAKEARRRGLAPAAKSWVIGSGSSNGVPARDVLARAQQVDGARLRSELGFTDSDFVAGFIGRITRDKGIETLTAAMSDERLDQRVKLLIIGPMEEQRWADGVHALGDRIVMVPWTDDVWGHLPAMDVLVLPTHREGFPNVVLEAAAVGIPAITTTATGAVDSVIDGVTGHLFRVGDHRQLVAHLNTLARTPERLAELGESAQRRAFEEFEPSRIWRGLREITESNGTPTKIATLLSEAASREGAKA